MPDDYITKQRLLEELEHFFTYYLSPRYLSDKPDPSIPDEVYAGKVNLVKDNRDTKNMGDESGENSIYKK